MATEELLVLHLTDELEPEGEGAAVSCSVSPFSRVVSSGESTSLVGLGSFATVTLMVLVLEELRVETARISAVPPALAVTRPEEDTEATELRLDVHFTELDAVEGVGVTLSW